VLQDDEFKLEEVCRLKRTCKPKVAARKDLTTVTDDFDFIGFYYWKD